MTDSYSLLRSFITIFKITRWDICIVHRWSCPQFPVSIEWVLRCTRNELLILLPLYIISHSHHQLQRAVAWLVVWGEWLTRRNIAEPNKSRISLRVYKGIVIGIVIAGTGWLFAHHRIVSWSSTGSHIFFALSRIGWGWAMGTCSPFSFPSFVPGHCEIEWHDAQEEMKLSADYEVS